MLLGRVERRFEAFARSLRMLEVREPFKPAREVPVPFPEQRHRRREEDASDYGRVEHDEVSELTYHPFQVDYDHADGHTPRRAPVDESFWVKSTSGAGSLLLDWKPRPGVWRAVVMHADGSRGVTAKLQFGGRTSLLWWVGAALLGVAVVAAAVAAVLYRRACR